MKQIEELGAQAVADEGGIHKQIEELRAQAVADGGEAYPQLRRTARGAGLG